MNFLNFYIAWVLSGDLSSHTEQCENKISGERGICTSLWFCAEVAKGTTIGPCKKDQSEDICCRIKRFDGTHEYIATSDILNKKTNAGLLNSLQTDLSSEQISLRGSPQTSDGKLDSTSSNTSGLPEVYRSPVMVEETHNMRKPAQLAEDFDSQRPVRIQESQELRSPVVVEETHNMRKPVQLAENFDSRSPVRIQESHDLRSHVMVEETHNMRKPVQLAEDFDSRRPVRIRESHDLRWPVVEEDSHDLRNTIVDEYEFPTESTAVENQSKKKTSETIEVRHFSNFYEYLESQGYFKESGEKDEINKECLDVFHELNKNKTLEKKKQEEKLPYIELLSSASEVCGISYSKTTPKLVGGKESSYLNWPWMVSLRLRRNDKFWHKCGAALLNRLWVITVAHCVEFLPPWDVSLRLGSYNLKREDEAYPYIISTVEKIIIHPQFNTRTFDNDVALLLMSSPVEFRPNISPICLPKKIDEIDGKTAIVLGWGKKPETRPLSAALHELLLPITSNKDCEQMYSTAGVKEKIQDGFFCAGTGEGGSDTCNGDSGGPMSLPDSEGRWSVIGLVSWGGICGAPHQPGVYTRIKNYVDWIEGIITCYQY